jgi:hypothetical protein
MSTTEMIQSSNVYQEHLEQQLRQVKAVHPNHQDHPNRQARSVHPNQQVQTIRHAHPNQRNQQFQQNQQVQTIRHAHPNHYNQQVQPVQTIRHAHPNQRNHQFHQAQQVQTIRHTHPNQRNQQGQSVRYLHPVQNVQPVQTVNKAFFVKLNDSASTSFGRACVVFAAKLFKQVFKAVTKDVPKSNCYQVFFNKYDDCFQIDAKPQDAETTSGLVKFQIHELLYGPLFNLDGKEDFCTRFDDPKFWKNQWGFNFSPFRVVQKLLKDRGLYFVDHTHKGNTPFLYLYRQLPARDVVKKKPWHNNYTIPELNKKDFAGNLLPHNEANIAVQGAFDKFVAMYMAEEFF